MSDYKKIFVELGTVPLMELCGKPDTNLVNEINNLKIGKSYKDILIDSFIIGMKKNIKEIAKETGRIIDTDNDIVNLFERAIVDNGVKEIKWWDNNEPELTVRNIAQHLIGNNDLNMKFVQWIKDKNQRVYSYIQQNGDKAKRKVEKPSEYYKEKYVFAWLFNDLDNNHFLWANEYSANMIRKFVLQSFLVPLNGGILQKFSDNMEKCTSGTFGAWASDTGRKQLLFSSDENQWLAKQLEQWRETGFDFPRQSQESCLEEVYERAYTSSQKEAKPSFAVNPQFMFVFGNWGDAFHLTDQYRSVRHNPVDEWEYAYDKNIYSSGVVTEDDILKYIGKPGIPLYNDFVGDLFSQGERPCQIKGRSYWGSLLTSQQRNALVNHDRDNIGMFMRAIYGTPMWGSYMTDFYKGIQTPDTGSLDKIIKETRDGKNKQNRTIDSLMMGILESELDAMSQANSGNSDTFKPSLLMTIEKGWKAYGKYINGTHIEPWRIIRWPHHSGNGQGYFKATTLSYAYGRIDRAMRYIWDQDNSSSCSLPDQWCNQYSFWKFEDNRDVIFPGEDGGISLYLWIEEGYKGIRDNVMKPNERSEKYTSNIILKSFMLGWITETATIIKPEMFKNDLGLLELMPDGKHIIKDNSVGNIDIEAIEQHLDERINYFKTMLGQE